MAGWLKRENDGSGVEDRKENNGDGEVEWSFTEFLKAFLEEVYGVSCLRPLPPVVGEGQIVDLLKLQIVVRKRGGYCSVSRNGVWRSVAADCGVDLRSPAALKLVYVKYLDTLDRWLRKIEGYKGEVGSGIEQRYLGLSRFLMGLESAFVSGIGSKVEKDDEVVDVKSFDETWSKTNGVNIDDDLQMNKKRKRECYTGLVNWIRKAAKDPGGPAVEALPDSHKWKCYGSEVQWKQVLLVREAMLLKRNVDAGSQQSVLQKKQKMHPGMYDDDQCGSERLRCSQRILSSRKARGTESSSSSEDEDNANSRKKRIPIGSHHQADIPEFQGVDYENEPKWLGTKIWPLDKAEQKKKSLIEREPIGKGRLESCGCQLVGSCECVRFHVREKRLKVKLELGSAFYLWKLDVMGEDVAFAWTKEDQNKFNHIVQSNPLSSEKYFWLQLFNHFPKKGREALVSYYFNVFLLQRRAIQNRTTPTLINSDDEDSEYGPIANKFGAASIFCSPKKPHSNTTR